MDEPTTVLEHACGLQMHWQLVCAHCGQETSLPTVHAVPVARG
ncbi:hypothetical protein [Streptomyces sp. NPDC020298]